MSLAHFDGMSEAGVLEPMLRASGRAMQINRPTKQEAANQALHRSCFVPKAPTPTLFARKVVWMSPQIVLRPPITLMAVASAEAVGRVKRYKSQSVIYWSVLRFSWLKFWLGRLSN